MIGVYLVVRFYTSPVNDLKLILFPSAGINLSRVVIGAYTNAV